MLREDAAPAKEAEHQDGLIERDVGRARAEWGWHLKIWNCCLGQVRFLSILTASLNLDAGKRVFRDNKNSIY